MLAALAAVSMWFYVGRILVGYQVRDAAAHSRPRGNLSDLYPRWIGARELLLRHRNPYSDDITLEIQKGYYGRALHATRPEDPKDQQGFAYPVYVVFLLAPVIWLPFSFVHTLFYWLLALLTAMSVLLWIRVLSWRLVFAGWIAVIVLTIGSFPVVQGIKLQQLSLLVAVLLAGAAACVASKHLFLGGVFLGMATIKPQLAWGLVAWLILWAISDWRSRRNFIISFVVMMALLLGGAEILLPGWLHMFVGAIGQYHQYTQNQSVIEAGLNLIVGSFAAGTLVHRISQVLSAIALVLCVPVFWKLRREDARSPGFGYATGLALALVVLIVPMYAPYNQVLLLPAIFFLAQKRTAFREPGGRLLYLASVVLLVWPWAASLFLTAVYLLGAPSQALNWWTLPLFSSLGIPLVVFALMLLLWKATRPSWKVARS
jgi:Glycosyltransferase family 87